MARTALAKEVERHTSVEGVSEVFRGAQGIAGIVRPCIGIDGHPTGDGTVVGGYRVQRVKETGGHEFALASTCVGPAANVGRIPGERPVGDLEVTADTPDKAEYRAFLANPSIAQVHASALHAKGVEAKVGKLLASSGGKQGMVCREG